MWKSKHREPTILVVDDDVDLTAALGVRLEAAGFRCVIANSFGQARHEFRTHRIDLVLADLHMPGGSGVTLIQSLEAEVEMPVVFMSGCADKFAHHLFVIEEPWVVRKPFEANELIRIVTAALEGDTREEAGLPETSSPAG